MDKMIVTLPLQAHFRWTNCVKHAILEQKGGCALYQFTGYLGAFDEDLVREDVDFLVTSCGRYRLESRPYFETVRPEGRRDYQLVFAAGGSFLAGEEGAESRIEAGQALLFRPGEPQRYRYLLSDAPDVCWMHFTGRQAGELLAQNGMAGPLVRAGLRAEYPALFERMIRELQLRRPGFALLCAGCGMELLALMGRAAQQSDASPAGEVMEEILALFHRDFREELRVSDLARRAGMSECWFIRSFKARTGMTPQRYLTNIRLGQARELLRSSTLNIGEIAAVCGYENALYFSRIFRKYTGVSPKAFRESRREEP